MQANPIISIILPCYNPVEGWKQIVRDNYEKLNQEIGPAELIIVNDGSTKHFDDIEVKAFFAAYPYVNLISYDQNQGKGYALREGVKHARTELITYTDIDFPYTFESFLHIVTELKNPDCDLAVGIRNSAYYTHLPSGRTRISKFFRFFIRKFFRLPTDDTQCGLKGFKGIGKSVFLQTAINGYLFDLEFIFLASRQKAGIKTVEVELQADRQLSQMRWTVLLQEAGNFMKIFVQSIF